MLSSSSLFQIEKQKDQVILTPKDQKPQQTLIFLHGWGEPGDNWISYFASGKATPAATKIILLTAPIKYNAFFEKASHQWFIMHTLNHSQDDLDKISDMQDVEQMASRIRETLDKEIEQIGDSRKCFIGGFSSGGWLAAYVWKTYERPLAGLIAYSITTLKTLAVNKAQEESGVFWAHGIEDWMMQYKHGVYNNYALKDGKRKFVHIAREGLGHGVDTVVEVETRHFMEELKSGIKPKL